MRKEDLEFFENLVGKENISGGFGRNYNLFCMEQGIIIAESLRNRQSIIDFNDMDFDNQKRLVPGLSSDHSGNTFGMSLRFAIAYLPMLRDKKIDSILDTQ